MKTSVTELLNIRLPIIQGGLAYLAYADLAAAVSNAGGLGQITAMSLKTPELLRAEIHKIRMLTDRPFGVNFAIGTNGRSYEDFAAVAIEEKVPVITITGGNPTGLLQLFSATETKKLVLVAGVRQAIKAEENGADAVIVVGQEGGGHLGRDDIGTIVLTPRVVDSVSIPVIASGGIGDGRGLAAAFALGAEGIEMGTRFIATKECIHAIEQYKERIIEMTEQDTIVISRSIGGPARVIRSEFTEKIVEIEQQTPTYEAIKQYISGQANTHYIYDGSEEGFGYAGQVAGLIEDSPSVQTLFDRIEQQFQAAVTKLNTL